ncbi:hypothetical protein [Escherichia albertii]|uniref:hypothetical protein n=1 Tax=Escherichia albertii TaxID=208962 RepID=UPI001F151177|nr:hypothetical protein [Escherichia albertii]MCZ8556989.1 hypothetical protein [Escherichia albertii]MCZ8561301.1 hypothetical protein [Escherichia albertii]MCZ8565566.1 hypothetical protein [Escherichia albertii]MCZ8569872.1 hypothetical protein [Escherichia albertii]MCZ8578608.1 hypothetical protein [Escherichia albertii]
MSATLLKDIYQGKEIVVKLFNKSFYCTCSICRRKIRMAKPSTIAGTAGALATAGTAASTASTVAGASGTVGAAAVSSGMAAIGSTVGGGMAAGAVITAAAPVAISAAVIYGLVKIFKN